MDWLMVVHHVMAVVGMGWGSWVGRNAGPILMTLWLAGRCGWWGWRSYVGDQEGVRGTHLHLMAWWPVEAELPSIFLSLRFMVRELDYHNTLPGRAIGVSQKGPYWWCQGD